VCVIIGAFGLN